MLTVIPTLNAGRPFYDSKSWIVNVGGQGKLLKQIGFETKVNEVEVSIVSSIKLSGKPGKEYYRQLATQLTNENLGRKFIDSLTDNGTSDAILKKLALKNIQRQDLEFGNNMSLVESGADVKEVLSDDYLPILMYNYFVVLVSWDEIHDKKTKTCYGIAIYHIDIDREQAFDILSAIGDPSRYNKLHYGVSLCTWLPIALDVYATYEKAFNKISKDVPALAVRGVLTNRNPALCNLGSDAHIKKGDLVSIYSQRVNKKGEQFSKRISRARVCNVTSGESRLNFEANTRGNRKNGDIVVKTPDHHWRFGAMATYMPHNWGGRLLLDGKTHFSKNGIITHFLINADFAMTDLPGEKFILSDAAEATYKSPIFFNAGVGLGFSKTFLGFFDIMPNAFLQYEMAWMPPVGDTKKSIAASSVKIPVGVRFCFNIGYPLKLALEAGYAFNFNAFFDKDNYNLATQAYDLLDVKRKGVFVNLGLVF